MSEIYPLRSPSDFAGTKCAVETCKNYCRFTVIGYGEANGRKGICAQHLAPAVKGVMLQTQRPPIIQEVPGNWGHNERAVIDGKMVTLHMGSGNGR